MGQEEFRAAIQESVQTIEQLLGHALGLRSEELCPICRRVMLKRVNLSCRRHVICLPCFTNLAKSCVSSKHMIRCPFENCDKTPFYSLIDFEGSLPSYLIKDYSDLINRKTELSQNLMALRKMRQMFNVAMYGNDLLDAAPESLEFLQIPEYEETLRSLLRQMSESAASYEFNITWEYHTVLSCVLSDCKNKVYQFQGLPLSGNEFVCSKRCLQIHYYELPEGEVLKTTSGVVLSNNEVSKFIELTPVQQVKLCFMCYDKFLSNELPPRDCEHVLCWKCLKDYMSDKIGRNQVGKNEFKCPECPVPFSPQLVQKAFPSGQLFERFLTFRFQKIRELNEDEIVIQCPNDKCAKIFVEAKSSSPFIRCVFCPTKICPLCLKQHHLNRTCAEYEKQLRDNEESK